MRHFLNVSGAALVLATLVGCATQDQYIATAPPAQLTKPATQKVDLKPICGTVKPYTPAAQTDLATAIAALPAGSPIIPAMGDYKRMRDEARACATAAQ